LRNQSFHLIVCSALIEHVASDEDLLRELAHILGNDGYLYLSTVVKKYGISFFRRNGKFVLDPDHVREYSSVGQLMAVLSRAGFSEKALIASGVKFSLSGLLTRLFMLFGFLPKATDLYVKFPRLLELHERTSARLPGYYIIDVLCQLENRDPTNASAGQAREMSPAGGS